jgi:hypothetical protein
VALSKVAPLAWNAPIVDEHGNPTPYFQRQLAQLLNEKAATDALATAAVPGSRQVIAGNGLSGGGALTADVTLDIDTASDVEVWTGTAADQVVTPLSVKNAATPVTVAYSASVTLDGNAGLNFEIDLTGNITFNAPSNMQPGDSGTIRIKQDATGSRIATWNAIFEFPGGASVGGILTTTANAVDYVSYIISNSGKVRCIIAKNLKA